MDRGRRVQRREDLKVEELRRRLKAERWAEQLQRMEAEERVRKKSEERRIAEQLKRFEEEREKESQHSHSAVKKVKKEKE